MHNESVKHEYAMKEAQIYELEPMNTKLIVDPKFRTREPKKWKGQEVSNDQRRTDWEVIKNHDESVSEPYIGGKELVNKNSIRHRVERKEISPA